MGRAKKNVEVEAQVIARGNVVPMMTETESEETVQYVSDEDAAREDRLVSEIRMITEQTKQVVLFNSIEIGRRLTEAKAMVKHGTWGTWLKERVDYSQRTANNFMKIYQEYGRNGLAEKSQALANLSYTQALALIDLPEDERARFAEERKAGASFASLRAHVSDGIGHWRVRCRARRRFRGRSSLRSRIEGRSFFLLREGS